MADKKEKTPEQLIAELQATVAAQSTIIAGQAEQLQASEAQGTEGRPVVTYHKQHYRVLAKQFDVEGTTIQALELKGKPDLVKKLVDAKSGVLLLLTKQDAAEA